MIAVWLGIVLLVAEMFHRSKLAGPEIVRKVVHIGVGHVILLAWWFQIPLWVGVSASVVFSAIALLSYQIPLLSSINGVGRQSLGTFFYAVSFGILIAWFWPLHQYHYAALGILIMTWGDGLAALVGQNFGKHPYKLWGMQKSWEGSLTMALVSYGVSILILWEVQGNIWPTWVVPIGIALIATGLEAFSKWGIDNLTVPLSSAAVGFLGNQMILAAGNHALAPWAEAVSAGVKLLYTAVQ